jgi:hypothetical protein
MGNEAPAVGERLDHREGARDLHLHQQLVFAEPERCCGCNQFVSRGGATHAGASGRDRPLHEHRKLRHRRQIIDTAHHDGGWLRNPDGL